MKAEDTTMTISAIESLFVKTCPSDNVDPEDRQAFMNMLHNLCTIQAILSFKQGVKQVVEWIETRHILGNRETDNGIEWQAQIKTWGIAIEKLENK